MTKARGILESEIQRQVADFLDLALPTGSRFTHIASGGHRTKAAAGKLKAEGVRKGAPDFVIAAPSANAFPHAMAVMWIELKRQKGGRVDGEQKAWGEALQAAGQTWAVCRSVDEVERVLLGAGVRLQATTGAIHEPRDTARAGKISRSSQRQRPGPAQPENRTGRGAVRASGKRRDDRNILGVVLAGR